MALTLEQAVGQRFLLSFQGKRKPPQELLEIVCRQHVGGVVLFRHRNVGSLAQLRSLTASLQAAAAESGQPPSWLRRCGLPNFSLIAIHEATAPGTVTEATNYYAYLQGFNYSLIGFSAAISVVILVSTFLVSAAIISAVGRRADVE